MQDINHRIIEAIERAQQGELQQATLFFAPDEIRRARLNELLFFVKPEITRRSAAGVDYAGVFGVVFDRLRAFDIAVREIQILGADHLKRHDVMALHYGTIHSLCVDADQSMSDAAREAFGRVYGVPAGQAKILGAFQFMAKFGIDDPKALNAIWQAAPVTKIGPGACTAPIKTGGETIYMVNGFHPAQLEKYETTGNSIVAFTLETDTDWKTLRRDFIGVTDPCEAAPGSLRRISLEQQASLGLGNVSKGDNGYHLSAGPVEGLAELCRFSTDPQTGKKRSLDAFRLGKALVSGYGEATTRSLMANAVVIHEGKQARIFDITEETNTDTALRTIAASRVNPPPGVLSP